MKIKLLVATLAVAAAMAGSDAEIDWIVPHDDSMSIEQYMAMGVPDPKEDWTFDQSARALEVLLQVDRSRLPRMGSERSGVIFYRMITHERNIGDPIGNESLETGRLSAQSFRSLYLPNLNDRLLFDHELIEMTYLAVDGTLRKRDDALQLRKKLESQSNTTEVDSHTKELLDRNRDVLTACDLLARMEIIQLTLIGAPGATGPDARVLLRERLTELLSRAGPVLSDESRAAIRTALLEVASLGPNEPIRADLQELAEGLE